MKILLLGANGQLGCELARHTGLLNTHHLIALTRTQLDISDLKQVQLAYETHQPDLVINAAAYTQVDLAEKEAALAHNINAIGAANLASTCQQLQIPLIHFSTDYIFNGEKQTPYTETDEASPLGVYGKTKWEGEQFVRQLCEKHMILRISWVFGQYGHNFVKTILRLAREKTEIKVVFDQRGAPTSTTSIADAVFAMIQQITPSASFWGTYHFCGTPDVSWYEFTQKIIEIAQDLDTLMIQRVLPISTEEYPTPAKRPKQGLLSCKKITDTFGIQSADWISPLTTLIQHQCHEKIHT